MSRHDNIRGLLILFILLLQAGAVGAETITYTYDTMGRLIRAAYGSGAAPALTYVYDNMGNRLHRGEYVSGEPSNTPPNQAASPTPANGAVSVGDPLTLGWTGSDPNPGDSLFYYVQMGSSPTTLELVGSGSSVTFAPVNLKPLTTYYWQVVSRDSHNAQTAGPVWSFTTGSGSVNPLKKLLTVTISGDGTVTSNPPGIACTSTCGAEFAAGSSVGLTATPEAFSVFKEWSVGECGSSRDCTVPMDDDRTVSATFNTAPAVRLLWPDLPEYGIDVNSIAEAMFYFSYQMNWTMLTLGRTYAEDFLLNENIILTWKGGYDGSYSGNSGITILNGRLTVGKGTLVIEKIAVR